MIKKITEAVKVVQWEKALASMPDDPTSISGTQGERKDPPPESCLLTPMCVCLLAFTHTVNKNENKICKGWR